jgi:hypothetical protein
MSLVIHPARLHDVAVPAEVSDAVQRKVSAESDPGARAFKKPPQWTRKRSGSERSPSVSTGLFMLRLGDASGESFLAVANRLTA